MFSILDRPTRLCDGISRREMLRVGGLSTVGLSLPRLLAAREAGPGATSGDPTFGRAKNIVFVWLQGGPPQHETFDPKPEAPAEIRGPFQPIQTNVPGVHFCELLPRIARIADKLAVVRSISTDNNIHSVSGYEVLTGYKYRGPNARMISSSDWPYFGSIIKKLKPSETLPSLSTVWLPRKMHLNENVTPAGQTAGFLGAQWDPDRFTLDPNDPNDRVEALDLGDIPPDRFRRRISLLEQVDDVLLRAERSGPMHTFDQFRSQAFDLLTSGKVRQAFEVDREPAKLRDRYGRTKWGQCLLLARRLIEAGTRMVHVNWAREPGDSAVDNPMWDTHAMNADRVEDVLCPIFDIGFTAFIEDLAERGMLDETLVVAIGEFGRTPKINAKGGRDHWGAVFDFVMAGAGVATAQVYGASDKIGAYPAKDRVTPADLTATIFHLLGIAHDSTFVDPQGRRLSVTAGTPIRPLLGSGAVTDARALPGGNPERVRPYDGTLLVNADFSEEGPLLAANFGSRPKGWRATPVAKDAGAFGVRIVDNGVSGKTGHALLGFGTNGADARIEIPADAHAILAQEMRSPRLGRFDFYVEASGSASSREFYEGVFLKNFACRLAIYRYTHMSKDPRKRQEFISQPFQPKFAPPGQASPQTIHVGKVLDTDRPGSNFPIGMGFGVAVFLDKTSPGVLVPPPGSWAHLRIDRVRLEFNSRTINDKVVV